MNITVSNNVPQFSLSMVIPAFNEEACIEKVISYADEYLKGVSSDYELIIVDDGSRDRTPEILERLKSGLPNLKVITHSKNMGPGSGLVTGYKNAKCEIITENGADMPMGFPDYTRFLEAIGDFDVVVGVRSSRSDYSIMRRINSKVYIFLVTMLFGLKLRDYNFVHMYRRKVIDSITMEYPSVFLPVEILVKARDLGMRIKEVDVEYRQRETGQSSCGNPKIICRTFIDMIKFWIRWSVRRLLKKGS